MKFVMEFAENLILRLMEEPKARDEAQRQHVYRMKERCNKTKANWSLPLRPYGFWTFDRFNAQLFWDPQISQAPGRRDPYDDLLLRSNQPPSSIADSEVALHEELDRLRTLAGAPELLSHDNSDIATDTVSLNRICTTLLMVRISDLRRVAMIRRNSATEKASKVQRKRKDGFQFVSEGSRESDAVFWCAAGMTFLTYSNRCSQHGVRLTKPHFFISKRVNGKPKNPTTLVHYAGPI